MAFPATVPGNGTLHEEDGVEHIVRNGRWEKLLLPCVAVSGTADDVQDSAADSDALGREWVVNRWSVVQHSPTERARIQAAFHVNKACYAKVGFWSKSLNTWLPGSEYKEMDGLVRWAGAGNGQGVQSWQTDGSYIQLGHPDATRQCNPRRPQFADLALSAINGSSCLLSIRFYSACVTDNFLMWNTARSVIAKPITDFTAVVFGLTDGSHFTGAKIVTEVF